MTSMAEPRKPSAGVTVFPLRQLHSHYRTHTLDTPGQQPQFIGGLMFRNDFMGLLGSGTFCAPGFRGLWAPKM